jgi:acetyl esterase
MAPTDHDDSPEPRPLPRRLVEAVEPAALRALLGLPRPVQRRLAGQPVVVDGQTLDAETQWLLRIKELVREPGPETLPIGAARRAILRQARLVGGRQQVGATRDLQVPGGDGPRPARLYVPGSRLGDHEPGGTETGRTGPAPLLLFVHGGGMMYGGLASHDALCRFLAERADVLVLSLDYRLAPEHPFPAAVDDCWAALEWTAGHADQLGADPRRLAVGGDSAGGYLSAVTAIRAAEEGVDLAYQLLIYPVTDMAERSESRATFGDGFYLTRGFMDLAEETYLPPGQDRKDPRVSVAYTEKLPEGLAPAYVATAGFDPLRDEGEAYARMLADAGVPVELKRYPGLIHGFANMVGAGRSGRAAVAEMAAKLKGALAD